MEFGRLSNVQQGNREWCSTNAAWSLLYVSNWVNRDEMVGEAVCHKFNIIFSIVCFDSVLVTLGSCPQRCKSLSFPR